MEEFRTPLSRAEAILENILGADNRLRDPLSNVEEILLSILNDTPYTKEPETLVEEMLLAIKEGTEMDAIAKNRVEEILLAIIHGEEYAKLPLSRFEELLIKWLKESAVTEKFLDFAPVLSFSDSAGKPLTECKVKIEPVQDLHGYENPWPAGGGKNLFDAYALVEEVAWQYIELPITEGTYTFSCTIPSSTPLNLYFKKVGGTAGSATKVYANHSVTLTLAEGERAEIQYRRSSGTDLYSNYTYQLESGSTATSYEPYSNICPISGHEEVSVVRCGKNLWGGEKLADDIVAKVTGAVKNATAKTISYGAQNIDKVVLFERLKPNTQYTVILNGTGYANLQFMYSDGTTVTFAGTLSTTSKAFTSTPSKSITALAGIWSSGQTVLNYEQCGVFEGVVSVDAYEPYQGETFTIELGDTIYGGTLDVTKGELIVDRAMVDLGTLNWSARVSGEKNRLYSASLPQEYVPSYSLLRGWICDTYAENPPSSAGILQTDIDSRAIGLYSYRSTGAKSTTFYLVTPKTTSPQGTLVYEPATPQTIQLTPQQITTLYGTNDIYADTGDSEVTYKADIH